MTLTSKHCPTGFLIFKENLDFKTYIFENISLIHRKNNFIYKIVEKNRKKLVYAPRSKCIRSHDVDTTRLFLFV